MNTNVKWTEKNQHDTGIIATGFKSLKSAKQAVDAFCIAESLKLGGNYLNKIIASAGFSYDDEPNVYYFSTDCVNA